MNSEELLKKFNFSETSYRDPVLIQNQSIGFSVKRDYDKDNNYLSLLYVLLDKNEIESKKNILSLSIRISFGKYSEQEHALIINDVGLEKFKRPISLNSNDEFFYNQNENIFFNKKNNNLSSIEILDKLYDLHVKPTKLIKGLKIRCKLFFWFVFLSHVIKILYHISRLITYLISGQKIRTDILRVALFPNDINQKPLIKEQLSQSKNISFLGYNAKVWTIIFYVVFHLLIYFICYYYDFKPDIIKLLLNNNFLCGCYVILSLFIFEYALPFIFVQAIKKFAYLYREVIFKQIKIN